jgi:hypothetical protein
MPSLNSAINRAARFTTRSWSARVRQLRRELGLSSGADPIYEGQHSPWRVLGLFPRLFAEPQPDWPRNVLLTGFPFWEERRSDTEMESTLRRFLETGTAPVVFTLGTSAVLDPGRFYEESARAVRRIGCRAVFLGASHSALANQAKDLLTLPYTQHDRVFRVACAIVHSGGIGTTASALRSGRPALVVPWGYDQPDNAARLTRMGVARTVGRKRYTARLAAQELERLLGDSITGAIVSGLPFRYSLRMAWRLQLPVLKTAYGKIVTLRPGVVEGDAKSLRAGFWERLRLFFLTRQKKSWVKSGSGSLASE